MDKYTIFDHAATAVAVAPAQDGNSPAEFAWRDLDAALQLLAERAQYLTGASGSSITLWEGGEMVCRASAGRAAPEAGVGIDTDSGLTAACLRTLQLVRCDYADSDPRVNHDTCRELGVKSVMMTPLLREQEVVGLFELVADRIAAFEERDVAALTRLAEMAVTAVEHADAAQRALPEMSASERDQLLLESESAAVGPADAAPERPATTSAEPPPLAAAMNQIGSCESCGFPVSQGRTMCVDCELAGLAEVLPATAASSAFSHLSAMGGEETWLQAHGYTLGALFIAALTVALLALKLR